MASGSNSGYLFLSRKVNAHNKEIWNCAWGRIRRQNVTKVETSGNDVDGVEAMEEEMIVDYVVTCSGDAMIKTWFVEDSGLKLDKTLTDGGHSLGVISVALNKDSTLCVSSSLDPSIVIWDLASSTSIRSIYTNPLDIWTVTFSPDDKNVISCNNAGKIHIYDVSTGARVQTFDTKGKYILSVAYSPDGNYIASGALDGIVNIFQVQTMKKTHTLEGHAMPIRSLAFSTDSNYLLTASDDGHMKVYSLLSHAELFGSVSGHASWALHVSFSPVSNNFLSCGSDHTVKVWELSPLTCLHTFKEHTDQVWCAKYNFDGTKVVSVSSDRTINIYQCPPPTVPIVQPQFFA